MRYILRSLKTSLPLLKFLSSGLKVNYLAFAFFLPFLHISIYAGKVGYSSCIGQWLRIAYFCYLLYKSVNYVAKHQDYLQGAKIG